MKAEPIYAKGENAMNISSLDSINRRKKILLALVLIAAALSAVATAALVAYYFDAFLKAGVAGQKFRLAVLWSVARPVAMTVCSLLCFLFCWRAEKRPWLTVLPMAVYYVGAAVLYLGFWSGLSPVNVAKYACYVLFVLAGALTLSGRLKGAGRWINLVLGLACVGFRLSVFVPVVAAVFGMIGVADAKTVTANLIALLPFCAELLVLAGMILHPFIRGAKEAAPEPQQ
ncbi:MAG: hypothetical protein J6X61_01975 [Clostridia bacterium]|nr:hypothetical protein [Clostridia bacterium]